MENKLEKRYGLLTAICLIVGSVIGSGVFFKANKVLENTNGNMTGCLIIVGGVGLVMLICTYVFSVLAGRYQKVNGVIDYAEASLGEAYGYAVGWFMTTVYYPTLASTLAWVSADFTCILFNHRGDSGIRLALAGFYLILSCAINALSPKLAGQIQVSATVIKLIPLVIMAIIGTAIGLSNGMTVEALTLTMPDGSAAFNFSGIFSGMVAFAFAFEGWIITTSINAELRNSKRNLPIALISGALIVIAVYLSYFLGLSGVLPTDRLLLPQRNVPMDAFSALFGSDIFGTAVFVFIIISCLGAMNGVMLGCSRGMFSLSARGRGPAPHIFSQIDASTNMPVNSAIIGLLFTVVWLVQWQLGEMGDNVLPEIIGWENNELPVITMYAAYVPIFIMLIVKGKELGKFKRFIMPILAIGCCVFMVYAAVSAYKMRAVYYLITFFVIMLIGMAFYKKRI